MRAWGPYANPQIIQQTQALTVYMHVSGHTDETTPPSSVHVMGLLQITCTNSL